MAKINQNIPWTGPQDRLPSAAEFFAEVQRYLRMEVNTQLRQVEPVVNRMLERAAAQEKVVDEAVTYMNVMISRLENQIQDLVSREDPAPMDWEPT